MLDLLAEQPLVLLFAVLAVGAVLGAVSVRGISIGPAGALFAGLAASAIDERLVIPPIVGYVGLALFTYCVGLAAGPKLARFLRDSLLVLAVVAVVLLALAPVAALVGSLFGLSRPLTAGLYSGAMTNTPALAAAQSLVEPSDAGQPVVGYALTYPFGVIGMLIAVVVADRVVGRGAGPNPAAMALRATTVRVGRGREQTVEALQRRVGDAIVSRIHRGGDEWVPSPDDRLQAGDIVSVTSPAGRTRDLLAALGDRVDTQLTDDRSRLDFRRMVVSNHDVVGHPISALRLTERHGAAITRVRRGEEDLLAFDDTILEPGDRVRVVAPPEQMVSIAAKLGDSERRVAELHPRGFAIGLLIGVLAGLIPIPLPGIGRLELGAAGGPLLIGLLLGWRERTGPLVWQVPHGVSFTLRQLGSLLFLGMAGTSGGAALADALGGGSAWQPIVGGIVVTSLSAVAMVALGRWQQLGRARTAGLIGGAQTQPAVLAFAAERHADPGLDLSYALVMPVAMVVKIVAAQLLVLL